MREILLVVAVLIIPLGSGAECQPPGLDPVRGVSEDSLSAIGARGETATWCATNSLETKGIAITVPAGHPWASCPGLIPLAAGPYPKIQVLEEIPLQYEHPAGPRDFYTLSGERNESPSAVSGPSLFVGTDLRDLANVFICHEGAWLFFGIH